GEEGFDPLLLRSDEFQGGAGEDAGGGPERLPDVGTVIGDDELADDPLVVRAAHLEDRDPLAQLAVDLDVAQQDDRVEEGGGLDAGGGGTTEERLGRGGEQPRGRVGFEERAEPEEELEEGPGAGPPLHGREAVDHDPG